MQQTQILTRHGICRVNVNLCDSALIGLLQPALQSDLCYALSCALYSSVCYGVLCRAVLPGSRRGHLAGEGPHRCS
jgi:hypothetical protein